ncbi:MAG: NUDIX hydrolase [Kyrpidia sp.]|nr:NUDIX hydrolase [Kyrpidia sp.]
METAAGGVVVRQRHGVWEILVIDDRFGHVSLPKGHQDPGETISETALREIEEETGIRGKIVRPIGTVRYGYTRPDGQPGEKEVHYYLVEAQTDTIRHQEEEIAGARWVPAKEALRLQLSKGYPNNTAIFEAALRALNEWA